MNTSKSISSIHYVPPELLKVKLDDLVLKNKIVFYALIKHLKEDDETKDHIHFYIVPNGKINADQLRNELEFANIDDITKPFRCLPFQFSKWHDWFLYILHDEAYLLSKMQTRKYHYQKEEIICSDEDYLNELIHTINFSKFKAQQIVIEMAKKQVPFDEIATSGIIPVQQFAGYKLLYEAVYNNALRRLRQTHDNIDNDTGELSEQNTPW